MFISAQDSSAQDSSAVEIFHPHTLRSWNAYFIFLLPTVSKVWSERTEQVSSC